VSLVENLAAARAAAGLSQQKVADATGIPRTAVSDIEHGKREVSAPELKAFADLYGMSMDALMGAAPAAPCPDLATLLRDTLARLEITQAELARRTGFSVKHINQLAQGLAHVTAASALRLERVTDVPAAEWHRAGAALQDSQLRRRPRVWWSPRFGVLEELLGGTGLDVLRVVTNQVLDALPADAVELLPTNGKNEGSR
jgi:transcriptional regulator with XRE-family HTH domain